MDKWPKNWNIYQFDDIAKFIDYRGYTPNKTDSGVPLITAKNVRIGFLNVEPREYISQEEYDVRMTRGFPQKGDVFFTTEAPLGYVAILDLDYKVAIGQRLITLQAKNNAYISRFLLYSILSNRFQKELYKKATGTTVKGIKSSILKKIQIPLPPLPEQTRIVSKLDALFARIDKCIALLEENIKHTNALIDSSISGIFDHLANEYQCSPLLKYVDFIGGSQPPKSKFSNVSKEGYVRLIQIRDYKSNNYVVYIDKKSTTKFCNENDVMIGRYGPPVFQILRGLNGAYNVALMKAVPNEERLIKDYLYYFLQNSKIQGYIISISQRSAGQSGVNKKALEMYEIAIPPLSVQLVVVTKIKSLIDALNKLIGEQQSKLTYLKALKLSLLDQAFKGEL